MPVAIDLINKNYTNLSVAQIRTKDSIIYKNTLEVYKTKLLDSQQMKMIMPMLEQYFKTYVTNDHLNKLLGAAYLVYNNNATPTEINIALGWSRRAVKILENSATLELTAKLLYRLNRKQESITAMQSAIDKADNSSDKNRLTLLLNAIKENKKI